MITRASMSFGLLLALLSVVASSRIAAQGEGTPLRLQFAAVVGDEPLRCGRTYPDIGTTRSSIAMADFRFYVSNVRFVAMDGTEKPASLVQDGLWQLDDVALLDFEDGTGDCANGTEPTRDVVEVHAPAGDYHGVRFDLGIPFEKNHREPTLQPSPLNLTRLFWNWNAGYKFLRMDLRTTGLPQGWMLHLGSTGCLPDETRTTVPTSCGRPNRVTVDLRGFDVTRDVVEVDVKAMLAGSNVDVNTEDTGEGCMSGQGDPECAPLLTQFGLTWGDGAPGPQKVFRTRGSHSTEVAEP